MYMCVYVCMCVRMYVDVVDIDGTFMHMCTRVRRYMGFTYAFLFGECVCVCLQRSCVAFYHCNVRFASDGSAVAAHESS